MSAIKNLKKVFFLFSVLILLFSCGKEDSNAYLYDDLQELEEEQKDLINILYKTKSPKVKFALHDKLAKNLRLKNKRKSLKIFLSSLTEDENNPYRAYWFLMLANEYMEEDMNCLAAYYFERIIKLETDIEIKGKSIYFLTLNNLIKITTDPKRLAKYYSLLLDNFYDKIEPAYAYFMLAQNYEKLGEWNLAIQTYSKFVSLKRFDLVIPGIPDNYGYARKILDYNASNKSWTVESLDKLVSIIKRAIRRKDFVTLERYRSKVNFFSIAWKQELTYSYDSPDFALKDFMYGRYIRIAEDLHPSSTPYDAYLRTSGWHHYSRIWYLYFRKINFPADPEIHGRWEWAGIYYGEKI